MNRFFLSALIFALAASDASHAACDYALPLHAPGGFRQDSHGTPYLYGFEKTFRSLPLFSKLSSCVVTKRNDVTKKPINSDACIIHDAKGDVFHIRPGSTWPVFVKTALPLSWNYKHRACLEWKTEGRDIPFYSEPYTYCAKKRDYRVSYVVSTDLRVSTDIESKAGWLSRTEKTHEDGTCVDQTEAFRQEILKESAKLVYAIDGKLYRFAGYDFATNEARFVVDSEIERPGSDVVLRAEEHSRAEVAQWGKGASKVGGPIYGSWSCYPRAEADQGVFNRPLRLTVVRETPTPIEAINKTSVGRVMDSEGNKSATFVRNENGTYEFLHSNMKLVGATFFKSDSLDQKFMLLKTSHADQTVCVQK